ncbi:NADPH-dependent FMN reductase [Fodinicola feengrottensis]|uniref:NAD(P)H-dependent oxidoreductase n=1 Tax=Fodinicola feengrottensis TaxID=435914 RepID=A0ABP4V2T4_9ACTN|nr:NAD(P)H-dependent oxidoreductase [Fodinicola feengrottensis]
MTAAQINAVILVGHPRAGSRTSGLAAAVAAALGARWEADWWQPRWRTVELADVVQIRIAGQPDDRPPPPTTGDDPFALVQNAHLIVVATPSFKGTYTGLLKAFLDLLPPGHLADTVVVPVAVAGSPAHVRSTSDTLSAVLLEVGATVPAPALGVPESDLSRAEAVASQWVDDHAKVLASALEKVGVG